jgi:hypothetical protein
LHVGELLAARLGAWRADARCVSGPQIRPWAGSLTGVAANLRTHGRLHKHRCDRAGRACTAGAVRPTFVRLLLLQALRGDNEPTRCALTRTSGDGGWGG